MKAPTIPSAPLFSCVCDILTTHVKTISFHVYEVAKVRVTTRRGATLRVSARQMTDPPTEGIPGKRRILQHHPSFTRTARYLEEVPKSLFPICSQPYDNTDTRLVHFRPNSSFFYRNAHKNTWRKKGEPRSMCCLTRHPFVWSSKKREEISRWHSALRSAPEICVSNYAEIPHQQMCVFKKSA